MTKVSGGQSLVRYLAAQGVSQVACVPGESYLPVLDALLDSPNIKTVTCRHESGASFMAEAWGKLTGKPGIVMVTRGPGACNASIGVHTAIQDSTPLILFMGQVARKDKGREAFQEIDVEKVFGSMTKWATEIESAEDIPKVLEKAFEIALSDRPGPVVIALPEDMLADAVEEVASTPCQPSSREISDEDVGGLKDLLSKAKQPVVLVGGSGWSDEACADLETFVSACGLPVTASFRRHDLLDHRNEHYIGELGSGPNPKLVQRVKAADLLLVIGARLNEITTQGYSLIGEDQALIQIHPSDKDLGKVYKPNLAIQSNMVSAAAALAKVSLDGSAWAGWREGARKDYEEWSRVDLADQPDWNGANMSAIFAHLQGALPEDAIVTSDAGNFSGWAQRYLRYGRPGRMLGPVNGAMGYAVPSAIAAAIAHPDRVVLGLCGDGGFMMSTNEIATAMHHGAKPIIMVCNNAMYGTIHMHQQRDFPGRSSGVALTNPDFVALGKSYGAFAARVEKAEDFPGMWEQALKADTLSLIEIQMDPAQITTNAKP